MTIAAFVVSIVALLMAGIAALFTWRQARAAEETAVIERRRHHAEREPRFEGAIESIDDGAGDRLDLRLVKGGPLANVSVRIVEGEGVVFAGDQNGVAGIAPRPDAFLHEDLPVGAAASWRVLLRESYSARMRLACVCRNDDGDEWDVSVWVELPRQPFVY